MNTSRRQFLSAAALGFAVPHVLTRSATAQTGPESKNDRPGIGAIGMRYQGSVITEKARAHGDIAAIADVDRHVREQARASFGSTPKIFEDYRGLLDRKDVDVVMIGVPDHWHVKMAIDACRADKDVYVEKPLTLTIDEGKRLRDVVRETGRVLQVGSWQRSDHRFRLAVEMVRQGRIGRLQRVDVVLGKNKTGGPFEKRNPPGHLNWDLWQGQTPDVPYIEERCHYTFRWWLEYSGGQMTDWGAHHLDIAQWGIGADPVEVDGRAKYPSVPDGYNVPIDFHVTYKYPDGVVMTVSDEGRNGIMFSGTEGRIFVNRGTVAGTPVDDLRSRPLPREAFTLYTIEADVAFKEVNPTEYVGVFFSGGRAPEYIRYDEDLVRITRHFFDENKPVGCVCHGVEIPAYAGCVQGRRMATVPKCKFDLEVCGGVFVDEPCVIDGNLVSGRTYHDNGCFVGPWIKLLEEARDGAL